MIIFSPTKLLKASLSHIALSLCVCVFYTTTTQVRFSELRTLILQMNMSVNDTSRRSTSIFRFMIILMNFHELSSYHQKKVHEAYKRIQV